ncbi:MAG: YeeE/YedE thiosulfate transporter family protein [Phycisphaerae bacterium]|jgi:uncharacterized membrane protein YedE/YeeE
MSMPWLLLIGLAFGVGFGYFVQRAGLCFAHGLGEIYMGRGKRILRLFLVIFIITCGGFVLSGYLSPVMGLKPVGQLRGYGVFNIVSGLLFGAGIALTGGCVLGTLRQLGEGNLHFLVVLLAFIPGLLLVTHVLNPLCTNLYHTKQLLLPQVLGTSAPIIAFTLTGIAGAVYWKVCRRKQRR